MSSALNVNALLDNSHDSAALWMPCSVIGTPDGEKGLWPHIILDRAKPGLIAVDNRGQRFINESNSYHDFVMFMLRDNGEGVSVPAYLFVDAAFLRAYGLGLVMRGRSRARIAHFKRAGYLIEGKTLDELAGKLGVDPDGLQKTVDVYNKEAAMGRDPAFHRGSSTINRFPGDLVQKPNPCIRPIGGSPFFAVTVHPADLACSAGLAGNANGQVLDVNNPVIEGLFACGNDLASIFRGT